MTSTNRIEKRVTLKAPQSRVWKAVTDFAEFGNWFGVKFDEPFVAGATAHGRITAPGYEGLKAAFHIERIDPESYFSYRWHPYAHDPAVDYSPEPMTLVEFRLEPEGDRTVLTIIESGFDRIPIARRAEAFRMNDGGWSEQIVNIENYVGQA